jgi:peptide/nickel transport system permease protein
MTLFITTALLYATVMLTPPEKRAELYLSKGKGHQTEEQMQKTIDRIIEKYQLNAPFPIQYYNWVSNLLKGNWGYSPILGEDVLPALITRTPVTAELTLYAVLTFIPLGLISGVIAGSRKRSLTDRSFRLIAYIASSLPPLILALVLMAFFYVGLRWFSPERAGTAAWMAFTAADFHQYTGFITIDGLPNGRPDVTLDALRHLVMPVITLGFAHWATLGRVTRVRMIEELQEDYVIAAKARGLKWRRIVWHHVLRNVVPPSVTSSILSAASLVTGVFVVEIIFNFHGVSELALAGMQFIPDAPVALGFTIYSVLVVLTLMTILDVIQSIVDPRSRERR